MGGWGGGERERERGERWVSGGEGGGGELRRMGERVRVCVCVSL